MKRPVWAPFLIKVPEQTFISFVEHHISHKKTKTMNNTILRLPIFLFVMVYFIPFVSGQRIGEIIPRHHLGTHAYEYFVKFPDQTDKRKIKEMLQDFNSYEIWSHKGSGLRLWRVRYFPYHTDEGIIANIQEHITRSEEKTDLDGTGGDLFFQFLSDEDDEDDIDFDELDIYSVQGNKQVKISILDTGITDLAENNSFRYDFGLTEYLGYDHLDKDYSPVDDHGHGSHLAGLIYNIVKKEQVGSPSKISFEIRKVFNQNGEGRLSDIVQATLMAIDEGADIINMSFSYLSTYTPGEFYPLETAIEYAAEEGVMIVASAGNQGINNDNSEFKAFPASFPTDNILTVASNDDEERLSYFSNYGYNSVDVSILGENIPGPSLNGGTAYASGTSFSNAIVTALSAVIGTYQESFDYDKVKCVLINSSKEGENLKGLLKSEGYFDGLKSAIKNMLSTCYSTPAVSAMLAKVKSEAQEEESKIYPNPFSEVINVSVHLPHEGEVFVQVFDELGRQMVSKTVELPSGYHAIEMKEADHFMPGAYFVRLITSKGIKSQKLIKR